jgi:hypothetical protein
VLALFGVLLGPMMLTITARKDGQSHKRGEWRRWFWCGRHCHVFARCVTACDRALSSLIAQIYTTWEF